VLNTMPATSDGIQVHGHWTMTVTNPDGTVEALREFDNSLHPISGAPFLTALLAGEISMTRPLSESPYRIQLNHNTPSDFFCEEIAELQNLAIGQGRVTVNIPMVPAAMVRDESDGNPLELSGICTVTLIPDTETASLVNVATIFFPDSGVWQYNRVRGGNGLQYYPALTEHALNEPIAVKNRQVIGLNVIISFD